MTVTWRDELAQVLGDARVADLGPQEAMQAVAQRLVAEGFDLARLRAHAPGDGKARIELTVTFELDDEEFTERALGRLRELWLLTEGDTDEGT